jgi:DNA-binding transcriptional ArsR family regulator
MQSKKDLFNKDTIALADFAKALSHPARIKILEYLLTMNICSCGEIVEQIPLSQATVSQHLKELKRVGLIQGEIEGPKVCYCVNKAGIEKAKYLFENLFETAFQEKEKFNG